MLRVVLKYTDCLQDGRNVFNVLAMNNIEILKTKIKSFSIYPRVTIRVKDYKELNDLISQLNQKCIYEVAVEKVKQERKWL